MFVFHFFFNEFDVNFFEFVVDARLKLLIKHLMTLIDKHKMNKQTETFVKEYKY